MSVFKYYDWTKSAAASASANDEKEKTMTYAEYKAKRNSASQNSVSGRTMTYKEYKARQVQKSANWFNSQMEQYIKDYTSFAEGAKKASGEIGYKNAYALRDAQFQAAESVIAKNQALSSFLRQYREVIDPEVYTQLNETLTSSLNSLNDTSNYFSNAAAAVDEFDTEDAYLAAIRAGGYLTKYEGMDHQQRMAQLSGLDADSEEHAWLKNYIDSNMTGADYAHEAQKTQWLIDRYEPLLEEYKRLTSWEQDEKGNARIDYIRSVHGDVSEFEKEIEDLKNQLYDYQNLAKYADLSKNADFEEKSVYQGDGSVLQKRINDQDKSRLMDNAHTIAQYVPLEPTTHTYSMIQQLWNYENTHLMTEDEVKNFNYLYNTQGKAAAKEYMDYLQYALNQRSQNNVAKKVAELTSAVPGLSQIVASMASTPLTLAGGTGFMDASAQKLIKGITGDDSPVDYNRDAMFASNISNTIRGTVSEDLTNALGDGWGEAASTAYQMGMSMQDSAAVAALSTINPALGTVGSALLAGNAATTTMKQAVENGASDEQALTVGLLAGVWEFVFEKYELDSILEGGKSFWGSIAKTKLSEAVGEASTELANIATDIYVLAENSNWEKDVQSYKQAYMEQHPGCSDAEAEKWAQEQAFKSAGWQVLNAFAAGWFTGGIMGAGMYGLQSSIANQKAGNNVLDNPGGVAALIQAAKDTGLETGGRQQAALERLSGKVSGEIASGTGFKGIAANVRNAINAQRVGKLYNQTVRSNSSLNVADMTAKLQEQGYTKREAASIAEAVDDAMWGRELTDRQNNLLENAMQDPRYQQAIESALLDKDSQVMSRFMRPEQAFAKQNVQQQDAVDRTESASGEALTADEGTGMAEGSDASAPAQEAAEAMDFAEAFEALEAAKQNGTLDNARYDQLMDSIQNAVTDYEAGNIDAATYNSLMQSAINQAGTASRAVQDGTYSARNNDLQVHVDDQTWQQAQKLAKALHRDIVFYNGRKGENGQYVDGTVYVNVNTDKPLMQVVCHEITHSLEGTRAYTQLLKFVLQKYRKAGYDIGLLRTAKISQYKGFGVNLQTHAEVDQEIVAEYMEKHLLADEQSILELVREEPNVARRILSWIKGMWKRLTAAGDAKTIAQMEWAQRIYSKALSQSLKTLPNEGQVSTGKSPTQVKADSIQQGRQQVTEAYRKGELTDEQHDAAMDEYDRAEEDELGELVGEYSFEGYADDGRGIYRSNFPKGTPKKAKGERILRYIQDVWSKKPITLRIEDANGVRYIEAKFDPTFSEDKNVRTDASKLMGGNRHGNAVEQRVTLDLADDYYQIAEEAQYNYSKDETGKDSETHKDVKVWHYFVNDIYFAEQGSDELTPFTVSINVKEKENGNFFYSFSAEKTEGTSTRRTLHADVNDGDNAIANGSSFNASIRNPKEKVNGQFSFSSDVAEQEQRSGQGWYDTDEKQLQAKKKGYPVLHGEQVVPFNTWVQAKDRGNYGLVTGLAPGNKLWVNFHNKHEDASAEVAIPYDNLVPVPGAYQMTKEEFNSLMDSEPLDVSSMELTEADEKALEEMYQRSGGEKSDMPTVDIEKMPRKAKDYLRRAENRLLRDLANVLGVSKFVDRTYLKEIVDEIANAYLTEGTVPNELISQLFDKAYDQGVIVDKSFYEQYKHIKDVLRTTAVTLSEQDRADIADFSDFRKRQFNRLRIVDKGGTPVNEFYEELHDMAPELFPESITHPADQLVQMAEVSRSVAVSERLLSEYYGKDAQMYRAWARNEFDSLVGQTMGDLFAIRRFAADKASKAAKEKAPTTPQEAMDVYKKLKSSRRVYERATARNLLTDHDEMMVGRLLRHEMELSHLDPERDNVKGITEVFEAKREYEEYCRLIRDYKKQLSKIRRSQADRYLETAHLWKDKQMGIAYSRETMRRNIYDIVPDKNLAREINEVFFEPVHDSEADATRMKNRYRKRVESLGLSRKVSKGNLVSEAHAVQLLGEAEDNIRMLENAKGRMQHRDGKTLAEWRGVVLELWKSNPNLDEARIRNGVAEFREIYDELFEQMNLIRVENGYEPISYRSGYFPHFQPDQADGILAQFGRALGIETQVVQLPTTISGLTHTFKPGIQWFGNAMERLGFNTAYDAVEGFDKYIEGAASVIHQTANIQNLRALAMQIRYRTSQEGIREQVDAVREDDRLSEDEKQIKIKDILEHGKYELANFVAELDEYTNLLANKKSKYDRQIEALMSRKVYAFLKWWEGRVAANMIAGNLSSAFTNFIPLTQAGAQLNKVAMLRGMWDTLKTVKADDGLVDMSSFLTNRKGSDPLIRTKMETVSNILATPMELIDGFTSGSIVRAAYYHNLKRGMSEAEAMHQADIFAAGVIADRSKGSTPTLFQSTNPLYKAFTQFQLEVNNQFSEVFKDLPRNHRDKGLLKFAAVLFQYFLGAFMFNELYEKLLGRRPALDPIGLVLDAAKDFRNPDVGFGEGLKNLAVNAVGELPFSSGLTLLGIETDGGRIPASSAVPDLTALWDAATKEGWSGKKRWKEAQDELNKLSYIIPPFGGNQISKLWKGVKALAEGGSYSVDAEGNKILQYPVDMDDPWSALGAFFRATHFGKSSLPEAQEWVDSGFDSLSAKETAVYQDMRDAGISVDEAHGFLQELGRAKKTDELSVEAVKRQIIRDADVSGEAKAIAYYGLMADYDDEDPEKLTERVAMDKLADMGADSWAVTQALMDLKDAAALEGAEETGSKYDAIINAALTDDEKSILVGKLIGTDYETEKGNPSQWAKFHMAKETGMSVDAYLEYRKSGGDIDDYLKLTDAGVEAGSAAELALQIDALEPAADTDKVSQLQKWRTCVDFSSNAAMQLAALRGSMTDNQYAKVDVAYENSVSPEMYVSFRESLPKYDSDGNGSLNSKEVEKAVRSMSGLTNKQRAVLWQLAVSSKSAKNNPFSTSVGQEVLNALGSDS